MRALRKECGGQGNKKGTGRVWGTDARGNVTPKMMNSLVAKTCAGATYTGSDFTSFVSQMRTLREVSDVKVKIVMVRGRAGPLDGYNRESFSGGSSHPK